MRRVVRYRDTLVDALRHWPTLYLNEDDVLLSLFFNVGTGYEWKNGCIVFDINGEDGCSPIREDPHSERLKDRAWREYCVEMPRSKYRTRAVWFRTKTGGIGHHLTEMFGTYSNILQLPNNIQPDWLAAAKRALDMARSYRVRTTREQKELLKQVAVRIKELQAAQAKRIKKHHELVQSNVRRARKADVLPAAGATG